MDTGNPAHQGGGDFPPATTGGAAGWHLSPRLVLPAGVTLVPLPPYSPELQPAERLWPLTNEALANRYFATLDDLDQAQGRRCVALQDDPDTVRSYVHYHWWPKVA